MSGPRIGSLFSGYGGLDMAVELVTGGATVWHSEIDPGACKILAHRYPDVPNIGDITAVDWSAVEPVDVLCGGFPCQDVSAAGKGAGIRPGTRSGLWTQFAYAIDQLRPSLVVVENVRGLLSADAHHPAHGDLEPCPWCLGDDEPVLLRALGAVLGDLAELGFDAEWVGLRAADVGAPHERFRVFVVAWPAADAADHDSDRSAAAGAAGRWPWGTPPDTDRLGHERGRRARDWRTGPTDGTVAATDPDESGRGADLDELRAGQPDVDWGAYGPAIRRWERVLGRAAPSPTEPGDCGMARIREFAARHHIDGYTAREMLRTGRWGARLAAPFVEFLMGLPAGWVTDVPGLTRNEQLKALGNGVVPQQAAEALRMLLPDVARAAA